MCRIHAISSGGLYDNWLNAIVPNGTKCKNIPQRMLVSEPYSLQGLWVMYYIINIVANM